MDFVRKQQRTEPVASPAMTPKPPVKGRRPRWQMVAGLVATLALIAGLYYFFMRPAQAIDHSKYQVVYLANGQAYFGKLTNTAGEYLVMSSPYTAQSIPAGDKSTDASNTTTLLKVSSQVYGPDDSIAIKSSQVLFWQNLRADSKVSQAIDAKK